MSDQAKGLLITMLGVLLVVPDSLFVRLIQAEPMVTAFWRGMTSGLFVGAFVLLTQGLKGYRAIFTTGWSGVVYVVLLGSTTIGFVQAIANTSVANAVFIFATMPIFTAIFSWVFLGEIISRRMVLTIVAVFAGLSVIAYGTGQNEVASLKGDLWAVYVTAAYAGAVTAVRKVRNVSLIPALPIASIGVACLIWIGTDPLPAFGANWSLILGHGAFIGAASCLLTIGPRLISATEVALLILLESVLAPILVWFVVAEHPGAHALAGGVIVIGALLISNLIGLRLSKRSDEVPGQARDASHAKHP